MKFTLNDSKSFEKHGIKLNVYASEKEMPEANTCLVECKEGHFQEFYDKKSTYLYYILEGKGTFYLNGKPIEAKSTDLIVAKPNTKIYYLGKMKMLLTVTPAWKEENEVHVRFVPKK